MVRAHVRISGRVQGVGFRYSCRDEAGNLALGGWVRNLPDGRVEAVFEGPKESVERALEWCRRGPPSARVTEVDVRWEEPKNEGSFDIRG